MTMDDLEQAEAYEQWFRDLAINRVRQLANISHRVFVTICQNCGEPLPAPTADIRSRWCDADCRDDWQHRQLNRGVNL